MVMYILLLGMEKALKGNNGRQKAQGKDILIETSQKIPPP